MPLEDLFVSVNDLITDTEDVSVLLKPYTERALAQAPSSTLLQALHAFVCEGMPGCTRSKLFSIQYMLNGDQIFMLDNISFVGFIEKSVTPRTPPLEFVGDSVVPPPPSPPSPPPPTHDRDTSPPGLITQVEICEDLGEEKRSSSHTTSKEDLGEEKSLLEMDADSEFIRELESFSL